METTSDEVLERILDFQEKVENPNQQKSGEEISVEDAVWLVEAALNYSYCIKTEEKANAGTNVIVVDSLFYEVSNSNNKVNIADAINTYLTIEADMAEMLTSYQSEVKFYDIVDVEYKNGSFVAYLAIRYKEGIEKSTVGHGKDEYTITEDWYWSRTGGKCDGTTNIGGAAIEISKWVNSRTDIPGIKDDVYGLGVYYTDVHYAGRFNTAYEGNIYNGINLRNYGIVMFSYYEDIYIPDEEIRNYICLDYTQSTYYAQECLEALSIIKNNFIEPNKVITSAVLWGSYYQFRDDNYNVIATNLYHAYDIHSGVRHEYYIATE